MITTRRALVSDANVIGDILVRSATVAYAHIASPEYIAGLDSVARAGEYERLLSVPRDDVYGVFLAEDETVPVGFAEIECRSSDASDAEQRIGLLHRMFFIPESTARGLGPILHAMVISEFVRWACVAAELTYVRGNDRARSFYLKHGWTETGETRPFDDHGRSLVDVVMSRPFA